MPAMLCKLSGVSATALSVIGCFPWDPQRSIKIMHSHHEPNKKPFWLLLECMTYLLTRAHGLDGFKAWMMGVEGISETP